MRQVKIELDETLKDFLTTLAELRDKVNDYYDTEFVEYADKDLSTKDASKVLQPILDCDGLLSKVIERLLDYNAHIIRNQLYGQIYK